MSKQTINVKITINDVKILTATFKDNATSQALLKQMPFTIKMDNLYGREMCYRFGHNVLPLEKPRSIGYQVGDISYWPPMGSLVFLYAQNGEIFEQQQIGQINEDISFFGKLNTAKVTFEQA